jgi:hypothetical protein
LADDAYNALYEKLRTDYGDDEAYKIMAQYGTDIKKNKANSFLGKLLSGEDVESPLVMYHSTSASKLHNALDLAEETYSDYALPNPSLQIVDPTKNAGSSYGDIILLGNKTIPYDVNKYSGSPALNGSYEVYSRDVYSPRKPNIEYKNGVPSIEGTNILASPDNVSKYMNKKSVRAPESDFVTPGSMAATQADKLKNTLAAVKQSGYMKPQEELEKEFDKWGKLIEDTAYPFVDKYMEANPNENRFSITDYVMTELQDAMLGKKPWNDPYGINTTAEGRQAVQKLKKAAKGLPTAYLEVKPKRAVPLKEFGGAILPEGFEDDRLMDVFKETGIPVIGYYDPNNYQESLGSKLSDLIKNKDRFKTKYLLGLGATGVGLAGLLNRNKEENE